MGRVEDPLQAPVETLTGIGPKRAVLLANLGIVTLRDLLFHLPRAYQDRRQVTSIAEVAEGDTVTIEAEVVRGRQIRLRGRQSMAELTLRDATGEIRRNPDRGFISNTPGDSIFWY